MKISRKRRVLAVFLNMIGGPGAGHMILGRYRRGLFWAALSILFVGPGYALVGFWSTLILPLALVGALVDIVRAKAPSSGLPTTGIAAGCCIALIIGLFGANQLIKATFVEAFKIPAGSMMPTLEVGDHIFARKLPFTPQRGDVIVFHYPKDREKMFIKRVVALGGDTVALEDNRIILNGKWVERRKLEQECLYSDDEEDGTRHAPIPCAAFEETLDGLTYSVIQDSRSPAFDMPTTKVPPGHIFVLGDNRDNSSDSRSWGTVAEEDVTGLADVIWWSYGAQEMRWDRFFQKVHERP